MRVHRNVVTNVASALAKISNFCIIRNLFINCYLWGSYDNYLHWKICPKDRAINKIILVDQVSNLRPNISTPKLSPTLQQTSKHSPYLTTYPQRVPKQHPQWHTLQEIGNYNFINISSVVEF